LPAFVTYVIFVIFQPTFFVMTPTTASPSSRSAKAPAAQEENWDARLGFLMHDVSRLRRSVFDEFMKPLGVTRSQWWVLAYLSRHDGMIQSDLAGMLELGKAALGGLIDRLEASGFIMRRPDETDRRVKRIFLSASGTQLIKEMVKRNHDMSERMFKDLSTEDRYRLADMLMHVKRNLVSIRGQSGVAGPAGEELDEA
jgi:MarR family transcriptional regulator, transcriptional regulator for hemolysin